MELYSKRKKAAENPPKAYRYDLPQEFRNQVWHIWKDAIGYVQNPIRTTVLGHRLGLEKHDHICDLYSKINTTLCDELGKLDLPGTGPCDALFQFFLTSETDEALDVIQASFAWMSVAQDDRYFMGWVQPQLLAEDAIKKLNQRFQEHAIGYRLEGRQIIRIDSEFLHEETTEPALRLMYADGYEGALEEFQHALKYYRQGPDHYDESLTNCLKAVESTLQKIIELRGWHMPGKATFDSLFAEVREKGLFPAYLGSRLGELKQFLQTIAVIRNEEGGHGSGSLPNDVPEHLVAYQIHLTGSAIVFLIRCNEARGKV